MARSGSRRDGASSHTVKLADRYAASKLNALQIVEMNVDIEAWVLVANL